MFEGVDLQAVRGGRRVFEGLTFEVVPGRALLLKGPNGSGKSTLLRMVAGLLMPRSGSVLWQGTDVYDRDHRHHHSSRLHFVGHQDPLKPVLSVAENLAFWMAMQGSSDDKRLQDALEKLGIGHLHDLPARFLSAGQKRRLNLARLLSVERALWLLDEPTVSLDVKGVAVFGQLVEDHLAAGGLVMAASHIDLGLNEDQPQIIDVLELSDFALPAYSQNPVDIGLDLEAEL